MSKMNYSQILPSKGMPIHRLEQDTIKLVQGLCRPSCTPANQVKKEEPRPRITVKTKVIYL